MGVLGYAALVVVAVLLGIRGGLLGVTSNTMLRGIVPDELLPKAMGLNSGVMRRPTWPALPSAALMSSAVSVGVLVGSLIASLVVQRVPGGIVVVAFYLLIAMGSLGAAFASQTVVRMAFLAASLLVFPAGNAVVGGFQTLLVNKENLGKAAVGMGVIGMAVGPVVSALAGLGSERLGYTATSFILTASIAVLALSALTLRGLITLPRPDQWQQHIKRCGLTTF